MVSDKSSSRGVADSARSSGKVKASARAQPGDGRCP